MSENEIDSKYEGFLAALDRYLEGIADGRRLDLYLLGRSALILDFQLRTSTKDIDFLQQADSELAKRALEMFGRDTPNAAKLDLYLEAVPEGLPPIPGGFRKRCREMAGPWKVIRLFLPEPHDLAATKLKRFAPRDREDLRWLADQGKLEPELLRQRLESAFIWTHEKDGDPDRDRAFRNLATVLDYLEGRTDVL